MTRNSLYKTPSYNSWHCMKQRTLNPKTPNYVRYGARGISVCKRWLIFANFIADMGERPVGTSLDRIDNNGNYSCGKCPECSERGWDANCRWSTRQIQNSNARSNVYVEHQSERLTVADWARRAGLPRRVLSNRLDRGWEFGEALSTPKMARGWSNARRARLARQGAQKS